jgi:Uma2 family endonuclease
MILEHGILRNQFEMVDLHGLLFNQIFEKMITLEEALIMGTNAPKSHQRIIARLTAELHYLYDKQKTIFLEPLPETMLNEGQTSPTPDIILYDNTLDETPVIIEINHSAGIKSDLIKVRKLIDEGYYGIQEGFVYDYKRQQWHKYKLGVGEVLDKPSFCEAIHLDLATLL